MKANKWTSLTCDLSIYVKLNMPVCEHGTINKVT